MDIQKLNNFFRPLQNPNNSGSGSGYSDSDSDDYGYGDGSGYGNGSGYGYSGEGYGYSEGDGKGNGIGSSSGYNIKTINNQKIYIIDDTETIITTIKNDVATGFILKKDLTLEPCYIVRNNYFYAHGSSLKESLKCLEDKTLLLLPIHERISNFKKEFNNFNNKIKASLLYEWHFKLTGSCKIGRNNFIKENNINLEKDELNVYEFIELTKNKYNGHIILKLLDN